jgi:hypothetical protein
MTRAVPFAGRTPGPSARMLSGLRAWFAPNAIRSFGPHVVRPPVWILSASHLWRASKCVPRRGVGSPSEGQRPGCERRSPPHHFLTTPSFGRKVMNQLTGIYRSPSPLDRRTEGPTVLQAKGAALVSEFGIALFWPAQRANRSPSSPGRRRTVGPLGRKCQVGGRLTPGLRPSLGELTGLRPFRGGSVWRGGRVTRTS